MSLVRTSRTSGPTSLALTRCAGTGRVFCAGQDLKEALTRQTTTGGDNFADRIKVNPYGFGSISRRVSKKPILVAMNGSAYGGGAEIVVSIS